MSTTNYLKLKVGHSVANKEIIAYANTTTAEKYIYLIAGMHGDEPEGVYVLEQLFSWLKLKNLTTPIIVIPMVNPDGYAENNRVNGNGIDLNRNWPTTNWSNAFAEARYNPGTSPLSEPENIFLHTLLQQFKPQIIFSFHSLRPVLDCNNNAKPDAIYLAKYNNYEVVDYIGYPTPGSLGAFVDEVLNCGIITYELPTIASQKSLQETWLENAAALQNYFLNFAVKK